MSEPRLIPIDELRKRFTYNPETGEMTGKRGRVLKAKSRSKDRFYRNAMMPIDGKPYCFRQHRIAFALMTGRWPKPGLAIDHINGDSLDNRWSNLREVTPSANLQNQATTISPKGPFNNRRFSLKTTDKGELHFPTFCQAWHRRQQDLRTRPATKALWREHSAPKSNAEIRLKRDLSLAAAQGWRNLKGNWPKIERQADEVNPVQLEMFPTETDEETPK